MTRCLLWLARAVLLWLLGRSPATGPRRALAWALAVMACALFVEGGLLGAALAAGGWLVAHLAALVWGAGAPLAVAVAALAGVRHALRRVAPPALLSPRPPSPGAAASSDTLAGADPAPHGAAQPGSSDTPPGAAAPPRPGPEGRCEPAARVTPVRSTTEHVALGVPACEGSQPRPVADDPLVAEAAWLEAHWAGEAQRESCAPSAVAPASI